MIRRRGISPLQENVLALLEEAGCPTATNDKIMALIRDWEASCDPGDPEDDYDYAADDMAFDAAREKR